MSTTSELILHVGHSKTGSSALQSSFALSTDALLKAGIYYPDGRNTAAARLGRITSGNLDPLKLSASYHAGVKKAPQARAILMSNEAAFTAYLRDASPLEEAVHAQIPIRVIIFIRDPIEWAVSSYMQTVKRHGSVADFEAFLSKNKFLARVELFFKLCDDLAVPILIRNYSRCRDTLLTETERLLCVPAGTLVPPPVSQVNRSMTRAELHILKSINQEFGLEAGYAVADALCEKLPDIAAEPPLLSRAAFRDYVTKAEPFRRRLNERLPENDRYRRELYRFYFAKPKLGSNGQDTLSPEQSGVVFSALRAHLGRQTPSAPAGPKVSTPSGSSTVDRLTTGMPNVFGRRKP